MTKSKAILIATVVSILGFVGQADYQDELKAQAHYCEMVSEGHWPAFNPAINCDMEYGK